MSCSAMHLKSCQTNRDGGEASVASRVLDVPSIRFCSPARYVLASHEQRVKPDKAAAVSFHHCVRCPRCVVHHSLKPRRILHSVQAVDETTPAVNVKVMNDLFVSYELSRYQF